MADPVVTGTPKLTLKMAIDRALEKNNLLTVGKNAMASAELDYKDAWDAMWLPRVSIDLSSTSSWTLGQLPGGYSQSVGRSTYSRGYPATIGNTKNLKLLSPV